MVKTHWVNRVNVLSTVLPTGQPRDGASLHVLCDYGLVFLSRLIIARRIDVGFLTYAAGKH